MDKLTVLIVGRGKLAQELLNGVGSPDISSVLRWEERELAGEGSCLVVHAGSGRELPDVCAFCASRGATLLDLSTGDSQFPDTISFPVVLCPNVNVQMLYFMAMIKQSAAYFRGQDIKIAESHQASKSTKPGTAVYMAKSLGVPESEIRSERDPKVQHESLGIPAEFLDRHAYHDIVITNAEVEIRLQTRVLGKAAYAAGLNTIIGIVSRRTLEAGFHDVVDLVMQDMV